MSKKKKKNTDFQKVRIKVGRKLKRQNETVVDLTRKKIKLPMERETPQIDEPIKSACRILHDTIESLNIERPILQLQALKSLCNILDPFVRQLMLFTHSTYSPLTVQSRSVQSLLLVYRSVFHSDKPLDLGLQLGDLLSVLTRVCRGAQDPGICIDLFKLFVNVIKLVSFHPTLPDVLRAIDQCAIALLQRVEPPWFWLGCRLICLVLEKHCQLISFFTEIHCTRGVSHFADPIEQLVHCSILSRCLSQLYTHLRQTSIRDQSKNRINLLEATLAYFKDDQYSMCAVRTRGSHPFVMVAPEIPSDGNLKSHSYIPINGLNLCQFANWRETTNSVNLPFIEMETPKLLFFKSEVHTSTLPLHTKSKSAKKSATNDPNKETNHGLTKPSIGDEHQRCERAMVVGMLNEGFTLLDDLSRDPQEPVLRGLLSVVRCLRVLFEYKPWIFFSENPSQTAFGDSKSSTDVHSALVRYIRRLLSVFPIAIPQEGDEPVASASLTLSPGLSDRDAKRAKKWVMKKRNREERRLSSASSTNAPSTEALNSRVTRATLFSRPVMSVHLLNQAVLELCTHLELMHSSCPSLGLELWPPPVESQEKFARLVLSFNQYGTILPSNVFLLWLRSFDLYLLAPLRSPRDFSSSHPQSRLFTAPILMCLHGLLDRLQGTVFTQPPLPLLPRQHRLLGRTVGVLTAFFTYALRCSLSNSNPTIVDEPDVAEVDRPGLIFYDDSWIGSKTVSMVTEENSQSSGLLSTLVRVLTHLVDTEPPRVLFAASLSDQCAACVTAEHMQPHAQSSCPATLLVPIQFVETTWASCLNRLVGLRCATAVEVSIMSPELKTKLQFMKQLEYQMVPLASLASRLGITLPAECTDGARQFGWLVPGYLPSTNCKYASAVFWRTNNRKDRWSVRCNSSS